MKEGNILMNVGKVIMLLKLGIVCFNLNRSEIFLNKNVYYIRDRSILRFVRKNLIEYLKCGMFGIYRELELVGLGYNFSFYFLKRVLKFEGGFSHKIFLKCGMDVLVFAEKKRLLLISLSKMKLINLVHRIKSLKKIDRYKGKGISFKNEILVLKIGKKK